MWRTLRSFLHSCMRSSSALTDSGGSREEAAEAESAAEAALITSGFHTARAVLERTGFSLGAAGAAAGCATGVGVGVQG